MHNPYKDHSEPPTEKAKSICIRSKHRAPHAKTVVFMTPAEEHTVAARRLLEDACNSAMLFVCGKHNLFANKYPTKYLMTGNARPKQ